MMEKKLIVTCVFWILIVAMGISAYTSTHKPASPPAIGQDIGGGVHTICHGSDRLYVSANSMSVVPHDSTCPQN